jgi:hypothetical protein
MNVLLDGNVPRRGKSLGLRVEGKQPNCRSQPGSTTCASGGRDFGGAFAMGSCQPPARKLAAKGSNGLKR